MQNNKHKGFTIVEVVIALAIFAILMGPIVEALVSSLKNTTKSKEIQYRNEFAENLMEYAKEDSLETVLAGSHLQDLGVYDLKIPTKNASGEYIDNDFYDKDVMTNPTTSKDAEYENFYIKGSMNLGTKHTKYSYVMEISSKQYAKNEVDEGLPNPNTQKLGVVEDLDYTKVALINGTIANYDQAVANAFLARKIELLRTGAPEKYQQYISSVEQNNLFSKDTGARIITVKVEGNATQGYMVSCILDYYDYSVVVLDNGVSIGDTMLDGIQYTPYTGHFDVLPDIYLMYNACVYNGAYASTDYIAFDTSGVTDKTPVTAFIVETAETYSDEIANALNDHTNPSLIYNSNLLSHGFTDRNNVQICMAATNNSVLSDNGKSLLNIYHNFWTEVDETGNPVAQTTKNKKNDKIFGDDVSENLIGLLANGPYKHLCPEATIGSLNEATQEERGLYTIKVWMNQGEISDVDTSVEPIISGTKGGNES